MYDSIQALAQIRGIKANLSSQLSGVQAQLDALNLAESICLQGVQSDQTRIDADTATGIAKGIEAAVNEATAPLKEQIQTLTDAAAGEADRTAAAVKEATDPLQAIHRRRGRQDGKGHSGRYCGHSCARCDASRSRSCIRYSRRPAILI